MDPITAASLQLVKHIENNGVPLTLNHEQHRAVVFVYSGDDWEAFSQAIRRAVDQVQESLLNRRKGGKRESDQ